MAETEKQLEAEASSTDDTIPVLRRDHKGTPTHLKHRFEYSGSDAGCSQMVPRELL
jgi:hypothetical protein